MKNIKKLLVSIALFLSIGRINPLLKNSYAVQQGNEVREESVSVASVMQEDLGLQAKSSYLMDYGTQTVMYKRNETQHLPIASMCKIMTLILSFEAIDEGQISMDDELKISEKAASMGGSQVFLEANASYPVRELIKSIVVCSANDSCVAMAERIAGSEVLFVEKMNEKAKEIGANDTLFANCTGLPKEPQYSCAKDVAVMLKELLSHKEYFEFGKVWLDKFTHPKGRYTEITNTNKLIRFYDGCDGGKTGFTNEAGFCLAATAKRGNMRVISVVIGEENSATRFEDVKTMFDFAFANYSAKPILEAETTLNEKAKISAGKVKELSVYPKNSVYILLKKGEKENFCSEIKFNTLRAPVLKGDSVGDFILFKDGVEVERVPLLANEDVKKATFFDRLKEVAENWNL